MRSSILKNNWFADINSGFWQLEKKYPDYVVSGSLPSEMATQELDSLVNQAFAIPHLKHKRYKLACY